MHKTQFMSQTRLTLPVTVEHLETRGDLRPVSLRDYWRNPDSAKFRFVYEAEARPNGPFDPWKLRDDFLAWPPEDWEAFVYMAGSFGTFRISKNDFLEWQKLLRESLVRPPREWKMLKSEFDPKKVGELFAALPFSFEWDGPAPVARIRTGRTLQAIIATIQLDALKGAQFRVCVRSDCISLPFKVEARHKIYCSPECAHLVAVRNQRARDAQGKNSKARAAKKKAARR